MTKSDIKYNYIDNEHKTKLIMMLIDDTSTIEDVLLHVDKLLGDMYNLASSEAYDRGYRIGYNDGLNHSWCRYTKG